MNYDQICYKRSCLSQVILRLDFLEYIDNDALFGSDVEKEVLGNYPKKGMQQLIRYQIMNVTADLQGKRAEKATRDGIQQEFSNSDGNKLFLSNKFIILEINKYSNYESVLNGFLPVFKTLLNKVSLTSLRTGIRYINFFSDEGIRPQKNYFTASIGSLLEPKMIGNHCIRSMAMNEYVVDDMHLNFRFGMFNQQYPQPMRNLNFVLDFDCFCDEALEGFESIICHIQKGHDSIQKLFEESITDQLRKVML